MKHLPLLTLTLSLFCLVISCRQSPLNEYQVLPAPQKIEYTSGSYKLNSQPVIVYSRNLENEADLLASFLTEDFGMSPTIDPTVSKGNIYLTLDPQTPTEKQEAYILEVKSNGIYITAFEPAGILNAIQSLRQIIQSEPAGKYKVQKGKIEDHPAFAWRAFMLDEGRYFKGKEVVKDLLDEMSRLKMNVFHWHLTNDQGWRIEIKKYPLLTEVGAWRDSSEINHFHSNVYDGKPHGGFYTQDEIREIVAYANDRHIMIVPEVSMPGHASAAIAAYSWLGTDGKQIKVPGKFGVHYTAFNVADPKVVGFLTDVMDEVIELFPAPVFHIGGDEVKYDQWKASPVVRRYMAEHQLKTPAELQIYFTNHISGYLASKNRKMMGWNEITGQQLHEYQSDEDTQVDQQLAPGTIVHFWKGDPDLIRQTVEKGYDIVNSYHIYTYIDYSYKSIPLEKAYSFNPVPEGLPANLHEKILGLGCQMWGEFTPTVESINYLIYPRIAAYAETGWSGNENKDYERFLSSLTPHLERWSAQGIQYGPLEKPEEN